MATIFFRTIIIYAFLLLAIRIMGKRQLGELEISELVITLMVSELAVLPISDSHIPLSHGIFPILILLSVEVIMSKLISVSAVVKRIFCGTPSILVRAGKIDEKELKRSRISVDELMSELRQNGCARLSDVQYAIIESNGKLSLILSAEASPPTAGDLGIKKTETGIAHNIIVNSRISGRALFQAGKSEKWLNAELKKRKADIGDILLMTVDDSGEIQIYERNKYK